MTRHLQASPYYNYDHSIEDASNLVSGPPSERIHLATLLGIQAPKYHRRKATSRRNDLCTPRIGPSDSITQLPSLFHLTQSEVVHT